MGTDRIDAESKVSGNQANIPARIRRELAIDDGDRLRWSLTEDGTVRVRIVRQDTGSFAGFNGYDGEEETDVREEHDAWGLET
ncbi:MAG: AbrB/MazE/SpoVT family DNA-binding domain-containing protein [Haloarculaceae archaeon]